MDAMKIWDGGKSDQKYWVVLFYTGQTGKMSS